MNKTPEEVTLGQELHDTETAIALGKQVLGEILASEPVNLASLESQRLHLHEARLSRNALKTQLEQTKTGISRHYRWY